MPLSLLDTSNCNALFSFGIVPDLFVANDSMASRTLDVVNDRGVDVASNSAVGSAAVTNQK